MPLSSPTAQICKWSGRYTNSAHWWYLSIGNKRDKCDASETRVRWSWQLTVSDGDVSVAATAAAAGRVGVPMATLRYFMNAGVAGHQCWLIVAARYTQTSLINTTEAAYTTHTEHTRHWLIARPPLPEQSAGVALPCLICPASRTDATAVYAAIQAYRLDLSNLYSYELRPTADIKLRRHVFHPL